MVINNLVKEIINNGGSITPLLIPSSLTNGTGLMNPSVYVDNDKLILNLRHVNYTLYHCEGEQLFNNRYGPLAYLNPENDIKLRTTNWYCTLDNNLNIRSHFKINTSKLDTEPVWEFIGLEDGRLVRWDDKLYLCGVRRDTKTNGEGRMELSELEVHKNLVKEIKRHRIEPPNDPNSYCEKNWMPVIDMPFHFIKWSNPTELVKVNIEDNTSETIILKDRVYDYQNLRGGSQVIPYGDYRICIIHEVDLWKNKQQQKDAKYTHRFIIWDKDWNVEHISDPFSFMEGEIEFCCGLAEWNGDLLITFGFQDNAAYIVKMKAEFFESFIGKNNKVSKQDFNWGNLDSNNINIINDEIFNKNIYEKHVKVKEGDVVLDIGSNVGAFTVSILNKNPLKVYCVEPSNTLIDVIKQNTQNKCVYINKAISDKTSIETIQEGIHIYCNEGNKYETITFKQLIEENQINKIDFLKIDCEGGEYDVFTEENKEWVLNNIKHIAGELHLWGTIDSVNRFKMFRDTYLVNHKNYTILNSHTEEDITNLIFNNEFIQKYSDTNTHSAQFLLYMTNN
jgi:FkbM family methyltransferase